MLCCWIEPDRRAGLLSSKADKAVRAISPGGETEIQKIMPGPGPGCWGSSTSPAYANGRVYYRIQSNTDARVIYYDLRAKH